MLMQVKLSFKKTTKMKPVLLVLMLGMMMFGSCNKSNDLFDPSSVEHFSFGTSYGMCIGDCAKLFAIANGQLFPDTLSTHYTGTVGFSSKPLADAKYQLAKELLDNFPVYLYNYADTTFGCPDCAD